MKQAKEAVKRAKVEGFGVYRDETLALLQQKKAEAAEAAAAVAEAEDGGRKGDGKSAAAKLNTKRYVDAQGRSQYQAELRVLQRLQVRSVFNDILYTIYTLYGHTHTHVVVVRAMARTHSLDTTPPLAAGGAHGLFVN